MIVFERVVDIYYYTNMNLNKTTCKRGKNNMLKITLVLLFTAVLNLYASPEAAAFSMENRVALEEALEGRVERIIRQVTGTEEVIVTVRVIPVTDLPDLPEGVLQRDIDRIRLGQDDEVLPGVSRSDLFPEDNNRVQANAGVTAEVIDRLIITVLVSDELDPELIERARNTVLSMLTLDFERGDVLEFSRTTFHVPLVQLYDYWADLLFPHVFYLIGLLLATLFLFGPARKFLKSFSKTMEVLKVQAEAKLRSSPDTQFGNLPGGSPSQQELLISHSGGAAGALEHKEEGDSEGHFSFVNKKNIKSLILLLRREPVEVVKMVLSYVSPSLRNEVLSALDEDVRIDVMVSMAGTQEFDPEQIKSVERKIKEKIEYLFDGKDNLLSLLDGADEDTQEKLLANLEEKNSELAAEVKKLIITFDDVKHLELNDLRMIMNAISQEVFVRALSTETEESQDEIIGKFPKGPATILRQELSYLGDVPQDALKGSRKKVIWAMRVLTRENKIKLQRPDDKPQPEEKSEGKQEWTEEKADQEVRPGENAEQDFIDGEGSFEPEEEDR